MNPPTKPRGFGCLMMFSVLCMTAWSAAAAAILYRLNPDWIDQRAFWRPPIVEQDLILTSDPAARDKAFAALEHEQETAPSVDPGRLVLFEPAEISGDYDPVQGLELTSPNGIHLSLPPGCIDGPSRIRMTPIAELPKSMACSPAGPVYEIRVGDQEHYLFRRSATITMPYLEELGENQATIAVWDGSQWQRLATRRNRDSNTATAQLDHLSPVAVLGLGTIITTTFSYAFSPTARSNLNSAYWWVTRCPKLETANFVIHYETTGTHAVVADDKYPLTNRRPSGDHPLFVRDLAEHLEDARLKLEAIGAKLPPAKHVRYDVFLTSIADCGSTDLGGPVSISTGLPGFAAKDGFDLKKLMRGTAAHELAHVAQGEYFGNIAGYQWPTWIECTGAYLGDRCWQDDVEPRMVDDYYLNKNSDNKNRLPARPPFLLTEKDEMYSYALFLKWLDRRFDADPGGGLMFVHEINRGKDASFEAQQAAATKLFGKSLTDLYQEFGRDFYHNDLWDGRLLPTVHRNINVTSQISGQFARSGGANKSGHFPFAFMSFAGSRTDWALTNLMRLAPLSSQAVYVSMSDLYPPLRKGKLVVTFESPGVKSLVCGIGTGDVGSRLPSIRKNAGFTDHTGSKGVRVIDEFGIRGGKNLATVVFFNPSESETIPMIEVKRWLLLTPSWTEAEREGPEGDITFSHWTVQWHRAELKDFPAAFAGYNIYRRKWGDPDSAFTLVQEDVQDEIYTDHAPDVEDYAYSVRVKDTLGNLSELAPVNRADPFQGTWDGQIRLVEGSLVDPLNAAFEKIGAEEEKKELEAIAKIQDADEKTRRSVQWQKTKKEATELYGKFLELAKIAEQFARLGIPLKIKIRRTSGKYFMSVPEIAWQETGMGAEDDLEFVRADSNTLKTKTTPPELPPVLLRLHRMNQEGQNEIRGTYDLVKAAEGNTLKCKFSWTFHRIKKADEAR
jgi:hypothetical protein